MNQLLILKQEKEYSRLFYAGLINGIGDRFSQVAVLGLLLSITGSGLAVGITFAVRLIPFLIFGPLGGMLADRFSKKAIMILTDVVRIFFALSLVLVNDVSEVWIIYVSSFLLSAGEALYAPARMSAIPQIVQSRSLLTVNGLEKAMVGFVLICGSITGGIISATLGSQTTFILNALSFLASALLLAKISIGKQKTTENSEVNNESLRSSSKQELRKILSQSAFVRAMLLVFFLWPIGVGIFNILISVYAVEVFHMGDIGIGALYGALGIGLVLGSGLTRRFTNSMKAAVVCSLLVEGFLAILISQSSSFIMVVILLIIIGGNTAIGNACNETILMNVVPRHFQGRFFGMLATIENTIMGTSILIAGLILEFITPRTLGFAGGVLFAVVGVYFAILFFKVIKHKDKKTPYENEIRT